jgi:predicted deacetylase
MNRALTPSHSLNKRSVFVVGVDDVHPESSSVGWDYGGDLEQGALGLISNFFNRHPQVKITLFVTPSWRSSAVYELNSLKHQIAMLGKSNVQTYIRRLLIRRLKYRSYPIDLERHRNRCRYLEGFVTVGRIGIGVHGLDHFQNHRPFSAEFERLGREEARNRLRQAQGFLARANLTFERAFSPPG